MVTAGAAEAAHNLSEGGGGQEGGQEQDRGDAIGRQLYGPDAPGTQAGGGAEGQQTEGCCGDTHGDFNPVGLQPLQGGAVRGVTGLAGTQI